MRRHVTELLSSNRQFARIDVNTVDGFQGKERDIIIYCCVRTSTRNISEFALNANRLNVAITRAKEALIVIGRAKALERQDIGAEGGGGGGGGGGAGGGSEAWAAFVANLRSRGLVRSVQTVSNGFGVGFEVAREVVGGKRERGEEKESDVARR